MHDRTEFAGASPELQREWIQAGLEMLRERGLQPKIFVAPRHGLDLVTLRGLHDERVGLISDGFAMRPYREHGLVWIPQQLWRPVEKKSGLWTICLHSNAVTNEEAVALAEFLERFASQFTSVEEVMADWSIAERSTSDRCFHGWTVLRKDLTVLKRRMRPGEQATAD